MGSGSSRHIARMAHAPDQAAATAELAPGFAAADTDQDGVLSAEELQRLLERAGARWPMRRVEGLLHALDADGDGHVKQHEVVQSLIELSKVVNAVVPLAEEKQKSAQEPSVRHGYGSDYAGMVQTVRVWLRPCRPAEHTLALLKPTFVCGTGGRQVQRMGASSRCEARG